MSGPKDRESDDRSGPSRGRSRRFWTATLEIDPETGGLKLVLPRDLSKGKLLRFAAAFERCATFALAEAACAPTLPPRRVLIVHPDGATSKLSSPNHRASHLPKKRTT